MALVSEVIDLARDRMLGFDTGFLPDNTEILRRITSREKVLVDRLIRIDRMGKSLPGDLNATVSVAVFASSYDYSGVAPAIWRIRQTRVNYSSGTPQEAKIVTSNWRHNFPPIHPSLYIQGTFFFPLDGATSLVTRIYGWLDAASIEVDYVSEPVALTAAADTLAAPDEAVPFLAADLAVWLGTRGKVAVTTLNQFKEDRREEEEKLFFLWEGGTSA